MPFGKSFRDNKLFNIFVLLFTSLLLKFVLTGFLEDIYPNSIRIISLTTILVVGAGFVLKGAAEIIEETTGVLSKKTKLAGGLLQSIGTAFPDMALGIVAAIVSLSLRATDYAGAVSYAIIAAATTFGSNIYNIAHAAWCIYRQNLANNLGNSIKMFPGLPSFGNVTPMSEHKIKPSIEEIDTANDTLNTLTLLTAFVAIAMVVFGKINNPPGNTQGDLYQLIRPVGIIIFILCAIIMYIFRKTKRSENPDEEFAEEEKYFDNNPIYITWISLIISGIAILFAAESMVHAVWIFCEMTGIPFVVAGVLAGIIGCLGEMLVVHKYSVNPNGRIGDALVGVAMDNIVTTMGASIVAIMGGIFLGGNALIIIFVIILTFNSVLLWQISKLKNYFLPR